MSVALNKLTKLFRYRIGILSPEGRQHFQHFHLRQTASNTKAGQIPLTNLVMMAGQISFRYLSYNNCQWTVYEERPEEWVKKVGKAIEKNYQL